MVESAGPRGTQTSRKPDRTGHEPRAAMACHMPAESPVQPGVGSVATGIAPMEDDSVHAPRSQAGTQTRLGAAPPPTARQLLENREREPVPALSNNAALSDNVQRSEVADPAKGAPVTPAATSGETAMQQKIISHVMKKPKVARKLVLGGGGPPVGLEIGFLKKADELNISFDGLFTACIGSWVGAVYLSNPKESRITKLEQFFQQVFVEDKIFNKFSVPTAVFSNDFLGDMQRSWFELFNPEMYRNLFLPKELLNFWTTYLNPMNAPVSKDGVNNFIAKGVPLNPFLRFAFALQYLYSGRAGKSTLVGHSNAAHKLVNNYIDFEKLNSSETNISMNVFNLTDHRLEQFSNMDEASEIDLMKLEAQSTVLNYAEPQEVDGKRYAEGPLGAVLNFAPVLDSIEDELKKDPNRNFEVWMVNILGYDTISPPKNQLDAELLAVEIPFSTIAKNNIQMFKDELFRKGLSHKVKIIDVGDNIDYTKVDFYWKRSTLETGINEGYAAAEKTITRYQEQISKEREEELKRHGSQITGPPRVIGPWPSFRQDDKSHIAEMSVTS
jgi:predicted acylesterase/phospholipase RssA